MSIITLTYPSFFTNSGAPLESGSIYIGVAGQNPVTSPIAIFWDDALTQPAAQPLSTSGGYIVHGATPKNVYTAELTYSILVKDHAGTLVYYEKVVTPQDTLKPLLANTINPVLGVSLIGGAQRVVTNIASLRQLLISGTPQVLVTGYYSQGDGGGGNYYYDAADSTSADNGGDIIVAVDGGRWKLVSNGQLRLRQFGAKGDNTTDDTSGVTNWFSALVRTGLEGYVDVGTFKITSTSTTIWDFSTIRFKGAKIRGAGQGVSIFNFTNITTGIALQMKANSDWYDLSVSDVAFKANFAGILVAIGDNSFIDPLNVANFTNVAFLNSNNNANNVALRLNYVVNSNFIGCRANCYADGAGNNTGTALECRQAEFNTFTNGSYGNAAYGVRFKDGVNFSNVFIGSDHENVGIAVATTAANSGNNTFIGNQFSLWTTACFQTTGSLGSGAITILNANYSNGASPAPKIDQVNYSGIRLIDGGVITTPAMPATTAPIINKTGKRILVTFWGGVVSQITVNGFGIGIPTGSVIVEHGETVALTYSATPTWLWQKTE